MINIGRKTANNKIKKLVVEIVEDKWLKFGQKAKDINSDRSKMVRIWIDEFIAECTPKTKSRKSRSA